MLGSQNTNDRILSTIKTVDHQVLERNYLSRGPSTNSVAFVPKTILKKKEGIDLLTPPPSPPGRRTHPPGPGPAGRAEPPQEPLPFEMAEPLLSSLADRLSGEEKVRLSDGSLAAVRRAFRETNNWHSSSPCRWNPSDFS